MFARLIIPVATALFVSLSAGAAERPNFVFLLVDDLGWADLGCNGSTFYETPHIDALAKSGMRFTNGYAACPVCSPTRASIMTGRHPVRVDITDWIPGADASRYPGHRFQQIDDRDDLALEEVTIAEQLREGGYQNFFAGKWHLGDVGKFPTDQGFDFNVGGHHKGSPPGGYYSPFKNPMLPDKQRGEYLTERLTDESVQFLEDHGDEKPFLLYLAYYNVHTPIQPYQKRVGHYRDKVESMYGDSESPATKEGDGLSRSRQDNADYASMVAAVDDSVGRLMQTLQRLGLEQTTNVIFFSDNGGLCTVRKPGPTSNLPLRSGKGWCYEGGIREPMIVRAPGITQPGSECDFPVISMDFFPTLLELAGMPAAPELHVDGVSLVPLLKGAAEIEHAPLVWHYPHYHGSTWRPGAAIRDGQWKLIEFYEDDRVELYDLSQDVGETTDLSKSNPAKTTELRAKLKAWQTKMNAKMPVEVQQ
ncbi:sulfatase [Stieleria sp. TO1_6]|uniref:sulfatase n=1 Tax=Stieleria tagensis TaxID=2956795 RepID=UPI00209BB293|nr:sulfatase [Stieleria tagensis]MCO8123001.1 sulfatase [Stieleria tagensis]